MPKKDPVKARDDARVEAFKAQIADSTQKAVWVLQFIYDQQTEAEKFAGRDIGVRDHKGFTPVEADSMNDLYEQLEEQGWRLTPAQCDRLRKAMQKYARQVLRLNGKIRDTNQERRAS